MSSTAHLSLPMLITNQAQKEVAINEGLITIDAILNTSVVTKDLNIPPESPVNGALYIIGNKPEGAWVGQDGYLAYFYYGWRFIKPNKGLHLWVNDSEQLYVYTGSSWHPIAERYVSVEPIIKIQKISGEMRDLRADTLEQKYIFELNVENNLQVKLPDKFDSKMMHITFIIKRLAPNYKVIWQDNIAWLRHEPSQELYSINLVSADYGKSWYSI